MKRFYPLPRFLLKFSAWLDPVIMPKSSTDTLRIRRVPVSDTCCVRHDNDTCNYTELCNFFKLLAVSAYQCPCRVRCPSPYPCFIV
ncbi:hypothetical protein MTR_7g037360 [Medicago truncatula]|uniref:Uncharacterized protein n=1 Tax=Medicago truncatula TaxID=3880 RepID=G7KRA1_MEDTR|nr:hypothetical protein MTR_7g037360 [Medicago truncatula]